jgi:hypothetical protein
VGIDLGLGVSIGVVLGVLAAFAPRSAVPPKHLAILPPQFARRQFAAGIGCSLDAAQLVRAASCQNYGASWGVIFGRWRKATLRFAG